MDTFKQYSVNANWLNFRFIIGFKDIFYEVNLVTKMLQWFWYINYVSHWYSIRFHVTVRMF